METAFRNVETAHDLEAGSERQLHLLRRRSHVKERAVNAIAQPDHFLEWFNMNVARAILDGLDENKIGEFDDGGFLAGGGQLVKADIFQSFFGNLEFFRIGIINGLLLSIIDDVLHAATFCRIDIVELLDDGAFRGDHRNDLKVGDAPYIIDGKHVQGVGHGQKQLVIQTRNGNDLVIVGQVPGQKFSHFRRYANAGEVDRRSVKDTSHGNGHVRVRNIGFLDDQFQEAGAFFFLLFQQFINLLGAQQTVFHQGVSDAFSEGFGNGGHGK